MKKIILLPFILILISSACKYDAVKDVATTPLNAQLKLGEAKYNVTPSMSVSLDSVLGDSRCPDDVVCIWMGNAEVRFTLMDNESETKFTLNTQPDAKTETVIHGYRIRLVSLTPYPNTKIVINQSDYKADLVITKE
jgi:hypothetical protein